MRKFILSLFITSFALASIAMDKDEGASKEERTSKEIVLFDMSTFSDFVSTTDFGVELAFFLDQNDRTSLKLTCSKFRDCVKLVNQKVFGEYQKQFNSLMGCQSIFDLKQCHFDFFRHMRKYFPEMLDSLKFDGLTALHKAVIEDKQIAATFLLALDVDHNIPVSIQVNDKLEQRTAAQLLNEKNIEAFHHFAEGPWAKRAERMNETYEYVWNGSIFCELLDTGSFPCYQVIDILVNCPNGGGHTRQPVLESFVKNMLGGLPTPSGSQSIELYINAGSFCDVAAFNVSILDKLLRNDSIRNILWGKGLMSKKAITRALMYMVHGAYYGLFETIKLESFLSKLGVGDIDAEEGEKNALMIVFSNVTVSSDKRKLNDANQLARLLLANHADPYYKILKAEGPSENPHFSPVIKLLENFQPFRSKDYLDCFIGLLEECKKRNFVLDDFKQWAGKNNSWVAQPRLCKFLMESGIDPLMSCMESYPLKHALDATLDSDHSLWSREVSECVKIMLPYCRDRLLPSQLALALPEEFYPNDDFWFLVREGFTCTEWAQNNISDWIIHPELCKLLLENGSIDPLREHNGTTPFKEVWSRVSNSYCPGWVLGSLEVMLPYCSERLISNPISLTEDQQKYLEREGKLDFFLKNGFNLPA